MKRNVRIVYVGDAKDALLRITDKTLLGSLKQKEAVLRQDPQYGDHIGRKYIPAALTERYGTDSLWRLGLAGYWRMIYTITGNSAEIVVIILDVVDHQQYDKLFGYKKK